MARPKPPDPGNRKSPGAPREPEVRIIGGKHRGRPLRYSGDPRTRPMKDRVREAVFNLLGPRVKDCHAVDLFAGTGALGLEALSRGAKGVTLIERHLPTTRLIEQNVATLGAQEQANVLFGNAFHWARNPTAPLDRPWVVFCSPPYEFFVSRRDEILQLIDQLYQHAPAGSTLVVEADERFNMADLPYPESWNVREYPPAVVAIAMTGNAMTSPSNP
jgi:16S rRNA (guanine966-N2)-methyltransferase